MRDDVEIVLASNRGPISFVRSDTGYDIKRGAGGLAGALDPVARRLADRAVWIATTTSETDRAALAAGAADDLSSQLGYPVYFISMEREVYSDYYDIASNRMLWFANHCLWDELGIHEFGPEETRAWEGAYEYVNERFARAVLEVSGSKTLVLFQDYHLATAPRYVRESRPDQAILHFTHSSFCGEGGLEQLPSPIADRVIEGMLGSDLVGFHVPRWCEEFMSSCERRGASVDREAGVIEDRGRRVWVRPYPIPIDAHELQTRTERPQVDRWAEKFRAESEGPLIVRADRAEPSKNVIRGFHAFERVLDRRPELRNRARFVACLYPSRQTMPEYRRYAEMIEAAAAEVNARYPQSIDLYMKDDFDRTLGALTVYDVLMVNSIMDGMNLVSKEGPAVNRSSGALVLSRGAGSFSELRDEAVVVEDPLDVDETADALESALDMPQAERRSRAQRLAAIVGARVPEDWIQAQIEDLLAIRDGGSPKTDFS